MKGVLGLHTPPEEKARVADLIRQGKTAKEAHLLTEVGIRTCEKIARQVRAGQPLNAAPRHVAGPVVVEPPSELRRLRDRNAHLQRQLDEALRERNADDDLRRAVFGLVEPMPEPIDFPAPVASAPSAETALLVASDWHWGERIDLAAMDGLNSYDTRIAEARAGRFFRVAVDLLTRHWSGPPPARLILVLGGDMISGEIHDELAKTNEASSIPAVKQCAGALMAGIDLLLSALACPVDIIVLPGNHGRTTRKPESKGSALTSYDTLLGDLLDLHFRTRAETRVTFFAPASGDALFSVEGWMFLATHGDRIGSRGGTGFIGPAATAARGFKRLVADYAARGTLIDVILACHFHTQLRLEEGYVNGCLPGPSEFARDGRFRPRPASQLFLAVHPRRGVTQVREIHVGAPEEGSLYAAHPKAPPTRPRFRVPAIGRAS